MYRSIHNVYRHTCIITLHDITFHFITLHDIALHYTTLHFITSHYFAVHFMTSHYTTLHYIALHNITGHHITLHYLALHYIHTDRYTVDGWACEKRSRHQTSQKLNQTFQRMWPKGSSFQVVLEFCCVCPRLEITQTWIACSQDPSYKISAMGETLTELSLALYFLLIYPSDGHDFIVLDLNTHIV